MDNKALTTPNEHTTKTTTLSRQNRQDPLPKQNTTQHPRFNKTNPSFKEWTPPSDTSRRNPTQRTDLKKQVSPFYTSFPNALPPHTETKSYPTFKERTPQTDTSNEVLTPPCVRIQQRHIHASNKYKSKIQTKTNQTIKNQPKLIQNHQQHSMSDEERDEADQKRRRTSEKDKAAEVDTVMSDAPSGSDPQSHSSQDPPGPTFTGSTNSTSSTTAHSYSGTLPPR
eukprot:TRINITY_DN2509_c0_g2_i1.p1 TRINITY_DN2509_c0_g2~~TRINITY_DN2509_c0_g2_i1.p1  ORF type:complete len:225 (+),score=35.40 TRINITY_DN2509_c0_g2_i1:443-1117(+)